MATTGPDVEADPPDMYGQVHPKETAGLIERKLKEFEVELIKLPTDIKAGYQKAQTKCPSLVNDVDFKLKFLRCEVFHADLAAKRFAKYWNKRIEILGPDKAFRPLSLQKGGAFEDDDAAMKIGFARLMGSRDPSGRNIAFIVPSVYDKNEHERELVIRNMWYVMHAAIEDVMSQQHGVIFVAFPKEAKQSQVDRKLMKMNMESIRGCIPVRVSGIHICHPPTFFAIIFPILKLFLGERLRKRIRVHAGSEDHVLERLKEFGLTKENLPTELGGNIHHDHVAWVEERCKAGM